MIFLVENVLLNLLSMRKLDLNTLKDGLPGISKAVGAFLAEAAMVCFEHNEHQSGVQLKVSGDFEEVFKIIWSKPLETSIEGSWRDMKEATEYGATAIALLLIFQLTDFKFFLRMRQDETGDFLIKKSALSTEFSFVEISGILKKSPTNALDIRVKVKKRQISEKAKKKLDLYTVVTEFSLPETKIVKNEIG